MLSSRCLTRTCSAVFWDVRAAIRAKRWQRSPSEGRLHSQAEQVWAQLTLPLALRGLPLLLRYRLGLCQLQQVVLAVQDAPLHLLKH